MGTIRSVDFNDTAERYFQFECDGDAVPGRLYPMRYDAVLHYADEEDERYSQFRLLSSPPANPDGEEVRIHQCRTLPRQRRNPESSDQRCMLPRQRRNPESSDENTNTTKSNDESESEPEEGEDQNYTTYTRTDPADWKEIKGRAKGRTVEPIPWTGGDEEFSVNITDEELELLKDESGDIRFHKVRSAHYLIVYWYHCY
jgi:hypothetical protein